MNVFLPPGKEKNIFFSRHCKHAFCLLVLVVMFPVACLANSMEAMPFDHGGHHVTFYNSDDSDYRVRVGWSGFDSNRCRCEETRSIKGYASGFRTGTILFSQSSIGTSGELLYVVGPSYSQAIYVTAHYDGKDRLDRCTCTEAPGVCEQITCNKYTDMNSSLTATTSAIKAPRNVTASNGSFDNKVVISWEKGSDIPDQYLNYKIYRGNTLIATVNGSTLSYEDTGMTLGLSYTYYVTTFTDDFRSTSYESNRFATGASSTGSTFTVGTQVSQGEFYNRAKISWNNVANKGVEDIKIERSLPTNASQFEEIAIVNKNATSYNDYDAIPGFTYSYRVTPLASGKTFLSSTNTGYKRPNGTIKGEVKSPFGAGISNVVVTISSNFTVEGTAVTRTYRDTTDASGYYEINDIYYYKEAEYTLTPAKTNHGFKPSSLKRILSLNAPTAAGISFTDTTVYTISGTVYQPGLPTNQNLKCPVKDVEIYVNGKFSGVKTAANGTYFIPIEEEGTYIITPKFYHHTFGAVVNNAQTANGSRTLNVTSSLFNVDFVDTQTDVLTLKLAGACNNIISTSAVFEITSVNSAGCYTREVTATGNNDTQVTLPAQAYRVRLKSVSPVNTNITSYFQPIDVDLTVRDTLTSERTDSVMNIRPAETTVLADGRRITTPADTTYTVTTSTLKTVKEPRADFIYRSAISINVTGWPSTVCVGNQQVIRMDQGEEYMLQIEVNNVFTFNNQTTVCRVDTGTVTVFDDVSDRAPVVLNIVNGVAYYTVKAGNPNIAGGGNNPYQKLFQVKAKVGFLDPYITPATYVLVTGDKPRTATFFTKTPELPFHIIHDPMGDASYSFLEKGTTITHNYATDVLVGGGAGLFARAKVGSAIKVFGVKIGGFFVNANLNTEFGRDNVNNNTITTALTSTERFSTSGDDAFTGAGGDVFIGGSLNMIYSLTDVVGYNSANCQVVRDTTLSWLADGLATTYIYTDKHIRLTLIPQLESLKKLADPARQDSLQESINLWKQVLDKNDAEKRRATFVENLSFSSGAPVEKSYTNETTESTSYEYKIYIDMDAALSAQLDIVDNEFELGAKATFRWSKTITETDDTTTTFTTGYHLEDDDLGDYFSVDVAKDRVYGTPVFRLAAGTSSCPLETGTLPRDAVQFTMDSYSQSNVPSDKPATFIANLTNLSQSEEIREYEVRVVTTSNLDGAIIKLGGQVINSSPAAFFIPAGETLKTLLTIERGPIATTYENLQLIMYSGCDYSLWSKGGDLAVVDTVSIDVYFRSECSNVALYTPGDNWLVNKNNNNVLDVALTGYDITNPFLETINVQYRAFGQSWQTAKTITKAELVERFYDYAFNVSALPDGQYELRAEAVCKQNGRYSSTYSSVQKGIIDRNSIAPFGTPSPADGFLRMGQEISVIFDKPINCNFSSAQITLVRADNGLAIPFTTQCASNLNKLIIVPTTPLSSRRELDGVELIATVNGVKDNSGNVQQYPISWSFKVNSKPVLWEPNPLNASVVIGSGVPITATLKNVTDIAKVFILTSTPAWLVPNVKTGAILANNDFAINFTVKPDLNPGIYTGKIIADIDGVAEELTVTLELLAIPVAWKVNPSDYDYTMNIVAQFSMDNSNTNLSTDTRDIIGVFVNGVARGVAKIQKIDNLNKYAAYITVYSNEALANRETLSFRMWKALTGVEYGAIERTPFVVDGTLGSVNSPYILHPEGIFQVIPLNKGWNSISLNVSTTDMSREKVFNSILASGNRISVKSQTQFAEFSPASGWSGTLTTFNTASSYMVYLSDKPDTLRVVGNPASISPISLTGTWNWLGYPRQTKADLGTALSTFAAKSNDLLKSNTAFATYTVSGNSGFWLGDLKVMEPGRGYRLKLSSPASLTYPNGRRASDGSAFEVDEQKYEYNMTVTATLQVNETEVLDDHFTVAAFVNGSCRGFAQPVYVPQLKTYRLFLTVHGDKEDAGTPIEFKVFNAISGNETVAANTANINFGIDQIAGNTDAPFLISWNESGYANGYFLSQNRPNPFSGSTTFDFSIPKEESVIITVYNQLGAKVKVLVNEIRNAGIHQVTFDSNSLPAGVYIYELKTSNYSTRRKMVVIGR